MRGAVAFILVGGGFRSLPLVVHPGASSVGKVTLDRCGGNVRGLEHTGKTESPPQVGVPRFDAFEEPASLRLDLRRPLPDLPVQLDAPQLLADPESEVRVAARVHTESFLRPGCLDPLPW